MSQRRGREYRSVATEEVDAGIHQGNPPPYVGGYESRRPSPVLNHPPKSSARKTGLAIQVKLTTLRPSLLGRERSSVGRASPCQGERRGFESLRSLHFQPIRTENFTLVTPVDFAAHDCYRGLVEPLTI